MKVTPAHRKELHNERSTTHAQIRDLNRAINAYDVATQNLAAQIERANELIPVAQRAINQGYGIGFYAQLIIDKLKIQYTDLTLKIKGTL